MAKTHHHKIVFILNFSRRHRPLFSLLNHNSEKGYFFSSHFFFVTLYGFFFEAKYFCIFYTAKKSVLYIFMVFYIHILLVSIYVWVHHQHVCRVRYMLPCAAPVPKAILIQ